MHQLQRVISLSEDGKIIHPARLEEIQKVHGL